jgi:hypothetical protein
MRFGVNFQSGGSNKIIEQGTECFFIFKEVPVKSCGFSGGFFISFASELMLSMKMFCGSAFSL